MHLQESNPDNLGLHRGSWIDWKTQRETIIIGRIIAWLSAYSRKYRKRESALLGENKNRTIRIGR